MRIWSRVGYSSAELISLHLAFKRFFYARHWDLILAECVSFTAYVKGFKKSTYDAVKVEDFFLNTLSTIKPTELNIRDSPSLNYNDLVNLIYKKKGKTVILLQIFFWYVFHHYVKLLWNTHFNDIFQRWWKNIEINDNFIKKCWIRVKLMFSKCLNVF